MNKYQFQDYTQKWKLVDGKLVIAYVAFVKRKVASKLHAMHVSQASFKV